MSVGELFPSEWRTFRDPLSGVTVRQCTNHKAHSHHFYFTNPGWYAGGRKLLFGSDRGNRTNLFGLDLESGAVTQLTDLTPVPLPREVEFLRACMNPQRDEAYFWHGNDLIALALDSLRQRVLYTLPEGFDVSMTNATADGAYVCASVWEDLSDRFPVDLLRGYVGFRETWEAKPLSRILRIPVDGGAAETVWEEHYWVGHVNTSPTQPNWLTFCHEGPWHLVDNRIWGLDTASGNVWPIRPREEEGEIVGHEYWHVDGLHISYHGQKPSGDRLFGMIRFDGRERREYAFPQTTGHIHSRDFSLVVGDGGRVVRLWQWTGDGFAGPKVLCQHNSSMHIQQTHVHPCFSPDGSYVLFTSDMSGYGNLYTVELPDFASLPDLEE